MKAAHCLRGAAADDRGQVTAFVIGIFLGLWLFAGIVVDGGLALAAKARLLDNAQEAARAGAQSLDLAAFRDTGSIRLNREEAEAAARAYLAATGDQADVHVQDDRVTVHVTHQVRTQILQLAGLRHLTVSSTATARPERATAQQRHEEEETP